MVNNEWLYGTWPGPTEYERRADAAVREYHRRCDVWDDDNLSGRYRGMSVPITDSERRAMADNVRRVRSEILIEYCLSEAAFTAALHSHWR